MTSRRAFVKAFGMAAAATVGADVAVASHGDPLREMLPDHWGAVDVERWTVIRNRYGVELRVYVDGHDVTRHCRFFDDYANYAELFLRDEHGRVRVDRTTGRPAIEVVKRVEVRCVRV